MLERKVGDKTIRLLVGDITDMELQAFVYDITQDAKLGSGYGNAIAMRGGQSIQKALADNGPISTGQAVITDAGKLKAQKIIHVNGPKFHEPHTEKKLQSATRAALWLAEENNLTQLAFPPIGAGFYQVPLDLCARVMVQTVEEHLRGNSKLKEVLFVALDTREYKPFADIIRKGA